MRKYEKIYKDCFQKYIRMKKPISATIEQELIKWVQKEVAQNKRFYRNKSHLIEIALEKLREEVKKHGRK